MEVAIALARFDGVRFNRKKWEKENTKLIGYNPLHPSAASVIRTLKRTCEKIELVDK